METNLVVNRVYRERLGAPYNEICQSELDLSLNSTGIKTIQYVQQDCIRLCDYEQRYMAYNLTEKFREISYMFYTNFTQFSLLYRTHMSDVRNGVTNTPPIHPRGKFIFR